MQKERHVQSQRREILVGIGKDSSKAEKEQNRENKHQRTYKAETEAVACIHGSTHGTRKHEHVHRDMQVSS